MKPGSKHQPVCIHAAASVYIFVNRYKFLVGCRGAKLVDNILQLIMVMVFVHDDIKKLVRGDITRIGFAAPLVQKGLQALVCTEQVRYRREIEAVTMPHHVCARLVEILFILGHVPAK